MSRLVVGTRVRTRLTPAGYAYDAAQALSGRTGTVEEVQTTHNNGRERVPIAPRFLVRFDAPAPTWSSNQTPPAAWWFDADELEGLP